MDIAILITMLDPMLNITIEATTWMIQHPLWAFPILLGEYIVLMTIWAAARGRWWGKYYKAGMSIFFIPQDLVVNYLLSVIFVDPPAHIFELVTGRMKRYKRDYSWALYDKLSLLAKFRLQFAYRLCKILNKFDPAGDHC